MSDSIIKVENLSKLYRLGVIGTGTLSHDLNRFIARIRGKEDPALIVDQKKVGNEEVWALKGVSFEIKKGEIVGIIGKNGAGKSTLLKILSRITCPTSGIVKMNGRVGSLLEVGTGFHPELTGRENVYLNGAILGMSKREIKSKIDEIVSFAGIEKYIDTPVKRYSSGMKVRLGFAVAAHLEPEILIIDEVLAVGDFDFQKKCIGKINEVASDDGRTILIVSHNMSLIESLAPRSIHIQNGMIVEDGNSREVIGSYLKQAERDAQVNLEDRQDRRGKGNLKLMGVEFLGCESSSNQIGSYALGEDVKVKIKVKNFINSELKIRLNMSLYGAQAEKMISCDSRLYGEYKQIGPNEEKSFLCHIKKPPLALGTYFANLSIRNCLSGEELEDWVSNACLIEFNRGGFDNRLGHNDYPVLASFKWEEL